MSVLARKLENAPDLSRSVLVVAYAAADGGCAALETMDEIFVGARHAGPAFLQEDARLDVDRPRIVLAQLLDRVKADEADVGVDFDLGAHVRDAMQQALLDGRSRPRVSVFGRKRVLDRRGALHVIARHAIGLVRHAIDRHRLVEMEMAFDEAWRDELAARVMFRAARGERMLDRDDDAVLHADVDRAPIGFTTGKLRVTNDQIQSGAHSAFSGGSTASF